MWRRPKYMENSQGQSRSTNSAVSPVQDGLQGSPIWEFADIGFDTGKKLWFLQMWNSLNQSVGFYYGKSISLNGCAIQYQWKDTEGRPMWHVRERFLASEFEGFRIDKNGNLVVDFKKERVSSRDRVPEQFAYLQYAYHLTNKDKNNWAPTGFIEFCDNSGEIVGRLNNKWIIVEDVKRLTVGELPKIRIRVNREDIGRIIVGRSSVMIIGRDGGLEQDVQVSPQEPGPKPSQEPKA